MTEPQGLYRQDLQEPKRGRIVNRVREDLDRSRSRSKSRQEEYERQKTRKEYLVNSVSAK
jgi:hypothetical protein